MNAFMNVLYGLLVFGIVGTIYGLYLLWRDSKNKTRTSE